MSAPPATPSPDTMTRPGFTVTRHHEPTLWLKQRLQGLGADLDAGNVTHCGHLMDRGAAPGIIALWKPRLAVCRDCQHRLRPGAEADRTCDRCGHHVPAGVTLSAVRAGNTVVVLLGLCDTCQRKEAAK